MHSIFRGADSAFKGWYSIPSIPDGFYSLIEMYSVHTGRYSEGLMCRFFLYELKYSVGKELYTIVFSYRSWLDWYRMYSTVRCTHDFFEIKFCYQRQLSRKIKTQLNLCNNLSTIPYFSWKPFIKRGNRKLVHHAFKKEPNSVGEQG